MAVSQIAASFQNDGNFSQLDVKDQAFSGPIFRIETFRCSQPSGKFGVTASGTRVEDLAGADHLAERSNKVFRHIFSTGQSAEECEVKLEIREMFTEDGAWDVRVRDLDGESATFGRTLLATLRPGDRKGLYRIGYGITKSPGAAKRRACSPLKQPVSKAWTGLQDLASPLSAFPIDFGLSSNPLEGELEIGATAEEVEAYFEQFAGTLKQPAFAKWSQNVQAYERFGDFRDKCIHPGTNLTGRTPQLASEFVLIRPYRSSLIALGRVFDPAMSSSKFGAPRSEYPLDEDTKPGVYTVFLSAFMMNIHLYKLGLDKVHSDYGGIPMRLAPGSRLETGETPVADAMEANRTLAHLAALYYIPSPK